MLASSGGSTYEGEGRVDGESLSSPFAGANFNGAGFNGAGAHEAVHGFEALGANGYGSSAFAPQGFAPALSQGLESPFAEAMATGDEATYEALAFETVMTELEDESFDEALQGLVDEAAARHLSSSASWSSESEAPALAAGEVEAWIGGVASEADRLLERLAEQFTDRTFETINPNELETEGARLIAEAGPHSLATEQFLGKLVKKAKGLVKGAVSLAKKGIAAVGKILPVGKIFDALKKLVQPLLKKVLQMALNKLPASVRPIAKDLAAKLFGARESEAPQTGMEMETIAETAEAFDARLAEALTAADDRRIAALVAESEAETETMARDAVTDLDAARARLARQLEAATPGVSPLAEMEQFIPVVMAVLPIIRMGMGIIGRDKVVRFLAGKLADLIKGHIGPQAAQTIARPIVDVGLRMLTLEAESSGGAAVLGAEAMVATLEDTIRAVGELPAEAFSDPLRLEAETHEAFVEAVSRHVPRSLLARNLRAVETAQDRGVWIYMPRVTRPCYRYKKYTHVFRVPIAAPTARAVRFPSGDTLERRLLDAGARVWPVQAEVHLYESLPGTQLGHLAAFETEAPAAEASEAVSEFEELTPEAAAMLVNEPGLGRRARPGRAGRGSPRRMFRVVVPGLRVRRAKRFTVRLDASAAAPVLRMHLRLSEREAHEASAALAKNAQAQVIAQIRTVVGGAFRAALTARLTRHLAAKAGAAVPPDRPAALAEKLAESLLSVVSAKLPESATALAQAARDAASGVTLTFEFRFADKAALIGGEPAAPAMTIRPGWHRD
jgi:hypothetical protein